MLTPMIIFQYSLFALCVVETRTSEMLVLSLIDYFDRCAQLLGAGLGVYKEMLFLK